MLAALWLLILFCLLTVDFLTLQVLEGQHWVHYWIESSLEDAKRDKQFKELN